jgi:hypothetical protein
VRGVTSGPDDDSQSFEIFASSPWRLGGQNIECVRFVIECHPIHWCESKVLYHFLIHVQPMDSCSKARMLGAM